MRGPWKTSWLLSKAGLEQERTPPLLPTLSPFCLPFASRVPGPGSCPHSPLPHLCVSWGPGYATQFQGKERPRFTKDNDAAPTRSWAGKPVSLVPTEGAISHLLVLIELAAAPPEDFPAALLTRAQAWNTAS